MDLSQPSLDKRWLSELADGLAGVGAAAANWPSLYINSETGKPYEPHHADEERFVHSDAPRYFLAKGGEGSGKSVAGIIKDLERLRRGMSGIMVSPDFEHLKKSLWAEFRRWCPANVAVEKDRYRLRADWEPSRPFEMHFLSQAGIATLYCGGIEDPSGWEGPNVHFAHFDEARRHKTAEALKVLAGRVRMRGPNGEPPQLFLTTTPRKHWLFEYFGEGVEDDPHASFKASAEAVTLRTSDNAQNLDENYERERRSVLTEAEARVVMDAEWEDIDDVDKFLPSMIWWGACREDLPVLTRSEPLLLAADAAVSGDTFGLVGVGRHPSREDALAVRLVRAWEPRGKALEYDEIEKEIRSLCKACNILKIVYDPYQLHQMMTRLKNDRVVLTEPFNQGAERLIADK